LWCKIRQGYGWFSIGTGLKSHKIVGLRTGGRRAKSLKNRVESSKIELQFREVRLEGSSPRAAVLQEIIDTSNVRPRKHAVSGGFLCPKFCLACSVLIGGGLVIEAFYEAYRNTPDLCSAAKRRLMPMFKIDKAVDDGMSGAVWV